MLGLTLRIIDGPDRGRIFGELHPPITIGREEGNVIQLNDERVSRFHLKIQEDRDRLVLTDLDSTNGTKVNGEPTQVRILRFGDIIGLGRSVILFGSRDEIAKRFASIRSMQDQNPTIDPQDQPNTQPSDSGLAVNWNAEGELQEKLYLLEPPDLPKFLTPGQSAELAQLLEYIHIGIRGVMQAARMDENESQVTMAFRPWQHLVDVQARLADYLKRIGGVREE